MTEGIDDKQVHDWLIANVEGLQGPFRYERVAGGRSNLTFVATDARGRKLVVRRPPLSHVIEKAHDMAREYRVLAALGSTPVPVPIARGLCLDRTVTGADFYVMDFVDGFVPHTEAEAASIYDRRGLSRNVIDVLGDLHEVQPRQVGLGDLGRGADYVGRQLRRWQQAWEVMKQRDLPTMDEVHRRLSAIVPPQQKIVIAHGDYRLGNMMVDGDRIAGLLDWELCTLGDPLADLGYLINNWADEGEHAEWSSAPTAIGGFASRSEMLDWYGDRTGLDLEGISYYRSFAYWRMGCIVEGVYARFLQGAYGTDHGENISSFADAVVRMSEAALEHAPTP